MSEKRKPEYVILLRNQGNKSTHKLEIFKAQIFDGRTFNNKQKFRVRFNGKWFPKGKKDYFNLTQIKELTFKAVSKDIYR